MLMYQGTLLRLPESYMVKAIRTCRKRGVAYGGGTVVRLLLVLETLVSASYSPEHDLDRTNGNAPRKLWTSGLCVPDIWHRRIRSGFQELGPCFLKDGSSS